MGQEDRRKMVHIGMACCALVIGRWPAWLVSAMCLAAFFFNWWVLPRLTGRSLERPGERKKGFSLGILMYPAILFLLSVIFFEQQIFLLIGWGAMAFGDGFAGILGQKLRGPKLPWNREKSWFGFLGFLFFGYLFTGLLLLASPPASLLGLSLAHWAVVLGGAMVFAALAETVQGFVDDNLVVPLTAATLAFLFSQITSLPDVPADFRLGCSVILLLAGLGLLARKVNLSGAIGGSFVALGIYSGGGFGSLALLFFLFVTGSIASQMGKRQKRREGIAQENRGARSAKNAFANGGVAAACGLLAWMLPDHQPLFLLMLAASMASATADTWSSELGNLYGKKFVNILHFKPDKRGLDGVISLEGSLLGAVAAILIGSLYFLHQGTVTGALVVAVSGIAGNIADSILGATLQRKGLMTNHTVNFANTLAGALLAYLLFSF